MCEVIVYDQLIIVFSYFLLIYDYVEGREHSCMPMAFQMPTLSFYKPNLAVHTFASFHDT